MWWGWLSAPSTPNLNSIGKTGWVTVFYAVAVFPYWQQPFETDFRCAINKYFLRDSPIRDWWDILLKFQTNSSNLLCIFFLSSLTFFTLISLTIYFITFHHKPSQLTAEAVKPSFILDSGSSLTPGAQVTAAATIVLTPSSLCPLH